VFNLQGSEIIVILLLALVVLGPEKLPDAVRKFTQTYSELKKMSTGFQSELKSALDEPMREMRETAKLVRDAADPGIIAAEAEAERRVRDDADAATPRTSDPTPVDDWSAPTPVNDWSAPTPGTASADPPRAS
jgi:sec-independent protein translocase protein TatB